MKKRNWIAAIKILSICCVGFVLGYCVKNVLLEKVDAAGENNSAINELSSSEEKKFEGIFDSNIYNSTYNVDTKVYRFVYSESKARESQNELRYTKDDAFPIAKELMNTEYEMVVISESDNDITYEERQGDYPTGGYVSFVFGDEGYLIETCYREGVVFDIADSKMISYDKAYSLAIEAIYEEYGNDFELQGDAQDYEYEFQYRPNIEKTCYYIREIVGKPKVASDIDEVLFYVTVSVDGSYVSVGRAK